MHSINVLYKNESQKCTLGSTILHNQTAPLIEMQNLRLRFVIYLGNEC